MKTSVTILLAALSTAALPRQTLGATSTWDALKDFSLSQSATSTWQYGHGTAGSTFSQLTHITFVDFGGGQSTETWDTPFENPWNIPFIGRLVSGSAYAIGTGVWTPDVLNVHPGETSDVIVQWTAPSAGTYSYSGLFQLEDVYPTGVIGEVYANSTQLYTGTLTHPGANQATLTPGQSESFSGSIALSAGDELYFAVNNDNGNYGFDTTGFDVTISTGAIPTGTPEPPQWAMLIIGFAGLALANRRSNRLPNIAK